MLRLASFIDRTSRLCLAQTSKLLFLVPIAQICNHDHSSMLMVLDLGPGEQTVGHYQDHRTPNPVKYLIAFFFFTSYCVHQPPFVNHIDVTNYVCTLLICQKVNVRTVKMPFYFNIDILKSTKQCLNRHHVIQSLNCFIAILRSTFALNNLKMYIKYLITDSISDQHHHHHQHHHHYT